MQSIHGAMKLAMFNTCWKISSSLELRSRTIRIGGEKSAVGGGKITSEIRLTTSYPRFATK